MDERAGAPERITYLIANYNRGAYIGDSLRSLRQQSNPNWLALVLDDASTDDSLQVIAPFADERVRLIIGDHNVGYIAALKRLIAEATTDIVAVLDADDALSPDATELLLRAYSADPRAEFVYSRFATYDAALQIRNAAYGSAIPHNGTALHGGIVGAVRSFRRSAYSRTAGLDDSMLYAEDRDLVYKFEEVTRLVFVDAVLYHYRDLPDSQSHDPRKREIGAINVRRARRAALRRRHITGTQSLLYELLFWGDYVAYSRRRPNFVRAAARWLTAGTASLCRPLDPRLPGRQRP